MTPRRPAPVVVKDVTDVDAMLRMPSLPLAVSLAVAVVTEASRPALTAAGDYALSSVTDVARLGGAGERK